MTTNPAGAERADKTAAHKLMRFLRFGVVGGSGVVVNLVIFHLNYSLLLVSMGEAARMLVANTLGFLVSVFTNFLLNDGWTWGDRAKGSGADWWRRLGKYYVTCSIAGVAQIGVGSLTREAIVSGPLKVCDITVMGMDAAPTVALLVGIAAGIAINFPASHLWAFRDAKERDGEA